MKNSLYSQQAHLLVARNMQGPATNVVRHSIVYAVGGILGMIGTLILLPLYTHVLSPEEFGILELFNRTASVLSLVALMGIGQAYVRFYFDREGNEDWQKTVTATTVVFSLLSYLVLASVVLSFKNFLQNTPLSQPIYGSLLLLLLAWIPLEILVNTRLTYLQLQMKSGAFLTINLFRLTFGLGLNFLLVYLYQCGLAGVMLAQLMATGLIAVPALAFFIRWTGFKVSFSLVKDMLRFGLPYLPASFFAFVFTTSDRYFLGAVASLEELGVYAFASKIGTLGSLLVMQPFMKVWAPFLFSIYKKPEGPLTIGRIITLCAFAGVTLGLLIAVFTPIALPLISGDEFHGAHMLVPIICFGNVIHGLAVLADAGILIAKKTRYKPITYGAAAGVALAANAILIPRFGAVGAATASIISFTSLFIANLSISNRFYRIHIEVRRITLIFSAAVITYLLSLVALQQSNGTMMGRAGSVLAVGFFPVILWAARFFTPEERISIRQWLRALKRARAETTT